MKSSRILPFTLLFATGTLFGQSCPINLEVNHGSWFQEREVNDPVAPDAGQRIHLAMTNLQPQKMVAVELTVHGLRQKIRLMDQLQPVNDLVKSIRLAFAVEGNQQGSTELSLSRFSVVTSVEVKTVTYADGSIWHELSPAACSVAPSALMRVDASR